MLTLSKQTEYGLLLLSFLEENNLVSLSQLTRKTKLPKRFLARIASFLVKNEIIESKEGKNGGYRLTDKIDKMTLYDYLKIFEGELNLVNCEKNKTKCRWQNFCRHKKFFTLILKKIIINDFKKYKLKDLLL